MAPTPPPEPEAFLRSLKMYICPERFYRSDPDHILIPLALDQHQRWADFGLPVRPDSHIDSTVFGSSSQIDLITLTAEEFGGQSLKIPPMDFTHFLAVLGEVIDVSLIKMARQKKSWVDSGSGSLPSE